MDGDVKGLQRSVSRGVMAALTGSSDETWTFDRRSIVRVTAEGATWTPPGAGWFSDTRPWTVTDPREAMEILQTRGLAPEDDERRGFVSTGTMSNGALCDAPDHMPDLVAWASLGIPAILRAEELARETVAQLRHILTGAPDRVVWRVGKRKTDHPIFGERSSVGTPTRDLWNMGLALDSITDDAVTLVVPAVTGDAR